jgi:solute carrier family 25 protein 46
MKKSNYGSSYLDSHEMRLFNESVKDTPTKSMFPKSTGDSGGFPTHLFMNVFEALHRDLFTYPFYLLRRTCQVNPLCDNYLDPASAGFLLRRICYKFGVDALSKGFSSALIVRGMHITLDHAIAKHEMFHLSSAIAHLLMIPFYRASFIETVQSTYASETSGLNSFLGCSIGSLLFWNRFSTQVISMHHLIVPTLTYEILYSITNSTIKKAYHTSGRSVRIDQREGEVVYETMMLAVAAKFLTTLALYPLETILNRLYIQGTRILIDNFDNDFKVIPSISNYDGVHDCYEAIQLTEGNSGFYKGVGFLVLQVGLEMTALQLLRPVLRRFL